MKPAEIRAVRRPGHGGAPSRRLRRRRRGLAAVALLLAAGCAPIRTLEAPGMVTAVPPGAGADLDPHHLGAAIEVGGDSLVVLVTGDNRPGYRTQSQRFGYPQLQAFAPGRPATWLSALVALPFALIQTVAPTLDGFQDLAVVLATHRPNGGGEARVRTAMVQALPADLVINTGDLVFDGRRARLWRDFEREFGAGDGPPGSLRGSARYLAAPGNHERIHTPEGRANWRAVMGPAPEPERFWFSIDAAGGLARFVFLDSNVLANVDGIYTEDEAERLSEAQLAWLERALDSGARYTFVVLHHPLALVGRHGRDWSPAAPARRRDRVLEACARHGVTAVFAGHEHLYRRIRVRAGDGRGTWLVTTGGGGGPLHAVNAETRRRENGRALPAGLAFDPATDRAVTAYHYLRLVIPGAPGTSPRIDVFTVDGAGRATRLERLFLAAP